MSDRLIRSDEHGPYVRTGGRVFRPLSVAKRDFFPQDPALASRAVGIPDTGETRVTAGDWVRAAHIAGTTTARVGDETWYSAYVDPQYARYQN